MGRSRVGSSQEIEKATELDLSSSPICLKSYGLNIALLYFHGAKVFHLVEKLSRNCNLQALETEISGRSYCTSLH